MLSQKRQLDKMIDAYVSWREACLLVSDTYDSWTSEAGPDATLAFGRYMSALDREEQAAELYAKLIRRVERLASRSVLRSLPLGTAAWEAQRS